MGLDKKFYPTIYNGFNYFCMHVSNLIHVSKRGPGPSKVIFQSGPIDNMLALLRVMPWRPLGHEKLIKTWMTYAYIYSYIDLRGIHEVVLQ